MGQLAIYAGEGKGGEKLFVYNGKYISMKLKIKYIIPAEINIAYCLKQRDMQEHFLSEVRDSLMVLHLFALTFKNQEQKIISVYLCIIVYRLNTIESL